MRELVEGHWRMLRARPLHQLRSVPERPGRTFRHFPKPNTSWWKRPFSIISSSHAEPTACSVADLLHVDPDQRVAHRGRHEAPVAAQDRSARRPGSLPRRAPARPTAHPGRISTGCSRPPRRRRTAGPRPSAAQRLDLVAAEPVVVGMAAAEEQQRRASPPGCARVPPGNRAAARSRCRGRSGSSARSGRRAARTAGWGGGHSRTACRRARDRACSVLAKP